MCFKNYQNEFYKQNVVLTGGSTGIELKITKAFIAVGANVWITGRSAQNLQTSTEEINSPKLKTVVSDNSNLVGIAVLKKTIADSGITLDVLFLNAGIFAFAPIGQTTEADFDAQFNNNEKGAFFTLQKLLPHLANGFAF